MKNYLMVALILCAIPAVAVAQDVTCEACTHVASVYMGEGGFIATADGDADMVTWVATCNGVTRSGELEPGDDGKVAALWAGNLACHGDEKSEFQIGPIMDGGWFWVTDADNSAVGGLVSMDILDNDAADITSAGDGVSMTAGKGAVYLKEASSGRVGILPNILPEPPMDALRTCGANDGGTTGTSATAVANAAGARFTRRMSECALGDGGTIVLATTTNTQTGATTRVMDKATLVRPAGTGTIVVTIDLWGNHSGFFTSAADQHALLGNSSVALTALRPVARLSAGVTWAGRMGAGPDAAAFVDDTAAAGITMAGSTTNVVTFTIAANTAHCSKDNNYPVTVAATATLTDDGAAALTPPLVIKKADPATDTSGTAGSTSFTVVCPSGSGAAQMGQELVPENPFPVSE